MINPYIVCIFPPKNETPPIIQLQHIMDIGSLCRVGSPTGSPVEPAPPADCGAFSAATATAGLSCLYGQSSPFVHCPTNHL